MLTDFHGNEAKKSQKFHGLVLGLVGLNDAKGIDLAQPIWLFLQSLLDSKDGSKF